MATTIKHKFGHRACLDCGERVVVYRAEGTDTLSYSCQECGSNNYAKKHEPRYKLWLDKTTPLDKPADPPAPAKSEKGTARPKFLGG